MTALDDRALYMIAVLPPPVNGMTLVSQQMAQAFTRTIPIRIHSASDATDKLKGSKWTLKKHGSFLKSLLKACLTSRGRNPCYFVPDSQMGLWLNLIEAPLLRLGFREVWLHHHVFSYLREPDWRMGLILRVIGGKARHIVLGTSMAEGLRAHYGASNIRVLGNGDFVRDVPSAQQRRTLKTIGFLGNITREKGIDLFLEVAQKAQADDPALRCLIAGPISNGELRAEIEAFCAADPARREWLGPVRGEAKEAFFSTVDTLLFPSLYLNEALPVTIYEALAAGTPVLATPRGCIPEQLEGTDWCHAEAEFCTQAARQIGHWIAVPDEFAAASRTASESFIRQQRRDRSSLTGLIAELGPQGAHAPHQQEQPS